MTNLTNNRRKKTVGASLAVIVSFGFAFVSGPAAAELIQLSVAMDQAQEVPAPQPVDGAGGLGTVLVNTDTNTIAWAFSVENLSGDAVGAHFHGPAAPGANAGVALDIGAVSGLGNDLVGTAELTAEQMEQLLAGMWYVNVHTAQNMPGEIRGQVVAP